MKTEKIQPKAEFLTDTQRADRHMEIVLSPEFRSNCETALLQYMYQLPMTQGTDVLQLKGAREFLDVLRNLGNKHVLSTQQDDTGLTPT